MRPHVSRPATVGLVHKLVVPALLVSFTTAAGSSAEPVRTDPQSRDEDPRPAGSSTGPVRSGNLELLLRDASRIEAVPFSRQRSAPKLVEFPQGARVLRDGFFRRYEEGFGLGADDSMVLESQVGSTRGLRISWYRQLHRGVRVDGAGLLLVERDGVVTSSLGFLVPDLDIEPTPGFDAAGALGVAKLEIAAKLYAWELDPTEPAPTPQLVIYSEDRGRGSPYRLAYRMLVRTAEPQDVILVLIDAQSGETLFKSSVVATADVSASGLTTTGKEVFFTAADAVSPNEYWLEQGSARQMTAFQIGANNALQHFTAVGAPAFTDPAVAYGVEAYYGMERFWYYLQTSYNYLSYDGQNAPIELYVYDQGSTCPNPGVSHAISPNEVHLCDDGGQGGPSVSSEVVAHELGHLLVFAATGGICGNQTAVLDCEILQEHLADVYGIANSFFIDPAGADFVIGEAEFFPPRSMKSPESNGQGDTVGGPLWNAEDEEHHRNGPLNYWYYLMIHGGSDTNDLGFQYAVPVVSSREKMEAFVHSTVTQMMPLFGNSYTLQDYRDATLVLAANVDPFLQKAAEEAWFAVGLGDRHRNVQPADDAWDVNPWDVQIGFTVNLADEKGWWLQVAKTSDFSQLVEEQSIDPSQTQQVLNETWALAGPTKLEPNEFYLWRVRSFSKQGVLSPWSNTHVFHTAHQVPKVVEPLDGELDVEPWDARITWEAVTGATGYRLQVSEDASFAPAVLAFDKDVMGETVAVPLKPGLKHYYRVKSLSSDPAIESDWSWEVDQPGVPLPEQWIHGNFDLFRSLDFTTDDMKIDGLSPDTCESPDPGNGDDPDANKTHPWDAQFEWSDAVKSDSFEIQIRADDVAFNLPNQPPSQKNIIDRALHFEEPTIYDLPVDRRIYWRVRATKGGSCDKAGSLCGPWTQACFDTLLPKVKLGAKPEPFTPNPNQPNSHIRHAPWPVTFRWDPVKGAEEFEIILVDQATQEVFYEDTNPIAETSVLPIPLAVPKDASQDKLYEWTVGVTGPDIVYDGGGYVLKGEAGVPATRVLGVDPIATIPLQIDPGDDWSMGWDVPPFGKVPASTQCLAIESPAAFSWQEVTGAVGYKFFATEMVCEWGLFDPLNLECTKFLAVSEDVPAPQDPPGGKVTFEKPGFGGAPMLTQSKVGKKYPMGVVWDVQAVGPKDQLGNDLLGSNSLNLEYLIAPTVPQWELDEMNPTLEFFENGNGDTLIELAYSFGVSHGAAKTQLFRNGSCAAPPDYDSGWQQGNPGSKYHETIDFQGSAIEGNDGHPRTLSVRVVSKGLGDGCPEVASSCLPIKAYVVTAEELAELAECNAEYGGDPCEESCSETPVECRPECGSVCNPGCGPAGMNGQCSPNCGMNPCAAQCTAADLKWNSACQLCINAQGEWICDGPGPAGGGPMLPQLPPDFPSSPTCTEPNHLYSATPSQVVDHAWVDVGANDGWVAGYFHAAEDGVPNQIVIKNACNQEVFDTGCVAAEFSTLQSVFFLFHYDNNPCVLPVDESLRHKLEIFASRCTAGDEMDVWMLALSCSFPNPPF